MTLNKDPGQLEIKLKTDESFSLFFASMCITFIYAQLFSV